MIGVARARELAVRVQKNHDNGTSFHDRVEHHAASRFGNVAGLLRANLPAGTGNQAVRIAVRRLEPSLRDGMAGISSVSADQRLLLRGDHQLGQVLGRGDVRA